MDREESGPGFSTPDSRLPTIDFPLRLPGHVGERPVFLVLVVELVNSAIEAVTDRVSLENHALAKRAKDLGSAAVMVALSAVPVVWVVVLLG